MWRFLKLQIVVLGLTCATTLSAQNIVVNEATPIGEMMQKFVELNNTNPVLEGWRIQLLATTDRQRVESEKQKFQIYYPNIPVDWTHSKPYYKLRAGAYLTRLETYRMLNIIRQEYPGAYPAADKIMPSELIN